MKEKQKTGRPKLDVKKKSFTVVCYPHQIEGIRKFVKSLKYTDNGTI